MKATKQKSSSREGWKANSLYLTEKDALALEALCKLEGESAASVIRQALREYGGKLAKRYGTTWAKLSEGKAPPTVDKAAK